MPVLDLSDTAACARYDEFVTTSPFRSLTQDRAWAGVKNEWGADYVYLEEDGRIVAAMAVLARKSLGLTLLYAPRGPVCDPADTTTVAALVREAAPLARKHRAFMLKMDPEVPYSPELERSLQAQGWTVSGPNADEDDLIQPRYNMILRFDGLDGETIMSKFKPKTRTLLRKCIKEGVHTTWGRDEESLRLFFDMYREMSERKGLGARPYDYFVRMRDAYPDLRIYIAWHEGDALAAGLTIDYHGKLYYLYAGSREIKRRLNANHLMNYDMIRWGIEAGGEQYDFGGVFSLDPSDGLYVFKHSFCRADGVTEYLGEIDVVYSRPVAALYRRGLPALKAGRRRARALAKGAAARAAKMRGRAAPTPT